MPTHSNALERPNDHQNDQYPRNPGQAGLTGAADRSDRCKQGIAVDLEQRARWKHVRGHPAGSPHRWQVLARRCSRLARHGGRRLRRGAPRQPRHRPADRRAPARGDHRAPQGPRRRPGRAWLRLGDLPVRLEIGAAATQQPPTAYSGEGRRAREAPPHARRLPVVRSIAQPGRLLHRGSPPPT